MGQVNKILNCSQKGLGKNTRRCTISLTVLQPKLKKKKNATIKLECTVIAPTFGHP